MKKLFLFIFITALNISFSQKTIFVNSKVQSATVYYNGAELIHSAQIPLPAGSSEIVLKNIANYLNENTIQIAVPKEITVLSVQFTNNYIQEYEIDESSSNVKKVRDSINYVGKEITKLQNQINTNIKTIELLDANQRLNTGTASITVTELMKLTDFYNSKRLNISNEQITLEEKLKTQQEYLSKLNARLVVNETKEEKLSQGKIILQVMNSNAGNIPFTISYLTPNANWVPFYDLRTDAINQPINLVYKAQIMQNTGVDWKKVKLQLSSGQPSQNNQLPVLNPWFLTFKNYSLSLSENNLKSLTSYIDMEQNEVKAVKPVNTPATMDDHTTLISKQLNLSFDIDIPYDILSNNKIHSVALKEFKIPAKYEYYAIPKLDSDVYLIANISDYSQYNLLPGEANIVFENLYVGKTFINPSQAQEILKLNLGRDKNVNLKLEKIVDKSGTKFLSNTKEQLFTYDINLRNNKKEKISLTLLDQYPISTDKEIEISLKENSNAIIDAEKGQLTWKMDIIPNEIKKYRISYLVKYPKNKEISNLY